MKSGIYIIGLIVICSILFVSLIGLRGLCEPDEGRYAEIAREMIETGDYLTPRLNYIKHFHKPPLAYWLVASSFQIFDLNEFAARLPAALLGILGVLIVYILSLGIGQTKLNAFLNALVLATTMQYFIWTQVLSSDMFFSFFIFLAILGLWPVITGRQTKIIYLFYLGIALAFLVKGPVAVIIPFLVLLFYALTANDWIVFKKIRFFRGMVLFLVISLPWFIYVCRENPGLFRYFIFYQSLERLMSTSHGREQDYFYFVLIFLLGALPWIVFLPFSIKRHLSWEQLRKRRLSPDTKPWLFLLLWLVVPIVFFSFSRSKLPGYILPIYPALAIFVGSYIYEKKLIRVFIAVSLVAAIVYLTGVAVLPQYEEKLEDNLSIRRAAQYIESEGSAEDEVVNFRCLLEGLPFYLQKRVILVEKERETQFEENPVSVVSLEIFENSKRVWCFTPEADVVDLKGAAAVPLYKIWENSGYVLLCNQDLGSSIQDK